MKPNSNSLQIVQYTDNSQIGSDMKSKKLLKNGTSLTFYVRATSSFAVVVVLLFCFVFFSYWMWSFLSSFVRPGSSFSFRRLIWFLLFCWVAFFYFDFFCRSRFSRGGATGVAPDKLLFFCFLFFLASPAFQRSRKAAEEINHTHTHRSTRTTSAKAKSSLPSYFMRYLVS